MSELAEADVEIKSAFNDVAADLLRDRMTITAPGSASQDAYFETTTIDQTVEAGVPCEYETLTAYEKVAGGGVVAGATHKIKAPYRSSTVGISANYKLNVAPRGLIGAKSFEVTGPLVGSSDGWLYLAAILRG